MLLLNECLLLLFISLSTQSGNFWIHPRSIRKPVSDFQQCVLNPGMVESNKGRCPSALRKTPLSAFWLVWLVGLAEYLLASQEGPCSMELFTLEENGW
jgi:hypothetical protein